MDLVNCKLIYRNGADSQGFEKALTSFRLSSSCYEGKTSVTHFKKLAPLLLTFNSSFGKDSWVIIIAPVISAAFCPAHKDSQINQTLLVLLSYIGDHWSNKWCAPQRETHVTRTEFPPIKCYDTFPPLKVQILLVLDSQSTRSSSFSAVIFPSLIIGRRS